MPPIAATATPKLIPQVPNRAQQQPGLLLIQIDGLSHQDFRKAVDEGLMPKFKARLDQGSLCEGPYHSGLPSQTVVAQGGILMGKSVLPANQWLEKGTWRILNPMGLESPDEVENDLAKMGDGGICQNGRTYLSPLAAGADPKHTFFALSTLAAAKHEYEASHGGPTSNLKNPTLLKEALREIGHLTYRLVQHPIQTATTLKDLVGHTRTEYHEAQGMYPERGKKANLKHAFSDQFTDVYLTDAATRSIQADMKKGEAPVIYIDMEAYDGANHPYRDPKFSRAQLPNVDRNIDILMKAAEKADRKYNVVVFADHGCCPGVFFKDVYGQTFPDYLNSILPANRPQPLNGPDGKPLPPVITQDFGSGVNVYFTNTDQAMSGSEVNKSWPGVIDQLKNHDGIAFVATREGNNVTNLDSQNGHLRIEHHADGTYTTSGTGANPLEQFGDVERTAGQVADMAHREHQGDVIVVGKRFDVSNGARNAVSVDNLQEAGDVMLNFGATPGLHGGLGVHQESPMLAFNPALPLDPTTMSQGQDLYKQLLPLVPDDSPLKQ